MANRCYLYSLSNRPTSYSDGPESISGQSEWSYVVPFSHRALMSGDPQLCSSLVDGGLTSTNVMPGLGPGIHVLAAATENVDGRDKPSHDV